MKRASTKIQVSALNPDLHRVQIFEVLILDIARHHHHQVESRRTYCRRSGPDQVAKYEVKFYKVFFDLPMKHRLYHRHIFHDDDNRNSVDTHYFLHILLLNFGSTKHAGRAKSPSGIFWSVPKDIHFTILVIVCSSF